MQFEVSVAEALWQCCVCVPISCMKRMLLRSGLVVPLLNLVDCDWTNVRMYVCTCMVDGEFTCCGSTYVTY